MTIEERIAIIKDKAKRDAEKLNDEKTQMEKERQKLAEQIRGMKERIETILILANTCTDNGIRIPRSGIAYSNYDAGKKYGYPHEFLAEGMRHHVGIICRGGRYNAKDQTFYYLGIENGGACGSWDFWTDGSDVLAVYEKDKTIFEVPRIKDMEQFLEEFPQFEAAFLKWIDSLETE